MLLILLSIISVATLCGQSRLVKEDQNNVAEIPYHWPVKGVAFFHKMPTMQGELSGPVIISLRDDPLIEGDEVSLKVYLEKGETRFDLYLLDDWLFYRSIFLPIDFSKIMNTSFDVIAARSKDFVDWELVLPRTNHAVYRKTDYMMRIIRSRLQRIEYIDDATIDKDGFFVKIADVSRPSQEGLNCSGFAKWVVDGLYQGRLGENIPVDFLKLKPYELRGGRYTEQVEDQSDPFFGLDWTRNLALAIDLLDDDRAEYGDSDVNYLAELKYLKDCGFSLPELRKAFYLLAVRRPGSFFIGSVNQTFKAEYDLRKHYHVAVFFPRFSLDGKLEIFVFESGEELSFDQFFSRYSDDYVHLVEFEGTYEFEPLHFENLSVIKR